MKKFAEVILQNKIGKKEETFTYSIPEELKLSKGDSVNVPLRNNEKSGIIWQIHSKKPSYQTKDILSKNFEKAVLNETQLKIVKWLTEYYFCTLHQAIKLFVPKRVFNNKPLKRKTKEKEVKFKKVSSKKLTKEQIDAIEAVQKNSSKSYLLQGVTGSGKTEVYCQLAKKEIEKGNQCLILVPEISLTPQTINYFQNSLKVQASVLHSKLSEGQKYKNWIKIWNNKSKLIIGSRSSLFAPFQSLSLIIIDEEHENSYKQESSPRYQVHKVIEQYQKLNPNLKAVYGSATPNIESSANPTLEKIQLNKRISDNEMPEIEIVDLKEEFKKKNYSIFSEKLFEEMKKSLSKKEQIILFLNRRGSSSALTCRDCGYSVTCPDCDTSMTFHNKTVYTPSLICHHCGKIKKPVSTCPACQSIYIKEIGIGTQKIEAETKKAFPKAKVLRADKDSTSGKEDFAEIYKSFKNHEADILIGTQMIAKGLHLPKVSLVGVIISDIGLNIPDFRASERIYQLMTQVAGRAGRAETEGKVIIQTYNPENPIFKFIKDQNYNLYFNFEREQRELLKNPPYSNLAKLTIEDSSFQESKKKAELITQTLIKKVEQGGLSNEIQINSFPAYILKLRNKYRYHILLKNLQKNNKIHEILNTLPEKIIFDSKVKIDIDPITTN